MSRLRELDDPAFLWINAFLNTERAGFFGVNRNKHRKDLQNCNTSNFFIALGAIQETHFLSPCYFASDTRDLLSLIEMAPKIQYESF